MKRPSWTTGNKGRMPREISAGGVVVREISGTWHVALIEPQKSDDPTQSRKMPAAEAKVPKKKKPRRAVLGLPKGMVDPGEKPVAAAVREVFEETGLTAEPIAKLADNKYAYVRTWGDGARVFKIVTFYLMRYVSGEIDDVTSAMRIEVKRALWLPLTEAVRQISYGNERKVLRLAAEYIEANWLDAETRRN